MQFLMGPGPLDNPAEYLIEVTIHMNSQQHSTILHFHHLFSNILATKMYTTTNYFPKHSILTSIILALGIIFFEARKKH